MSRKHESGGVEAFRRWTFAHRKGLVAGAAGVLITAAAWRLLRRGNNPRDYLSGEEAAALGDVGADLRRGRRGEKHSPRAEREQAMIATMADPEQVGGFTAMVSADARQYGDEMTRVGAQRAAAYRNEDGEWQAGLVPDKAVLFTEQDGVRRAHVALHLGGPATEVALGLSNPPETDQDKPVFTPIATRLEGIGFIAGDAVVFPDTPSGTID